MITEQIQISLILTALILRSALVKSVMLFGVSYNISIIVPVSVRVTAGKEFCSDDSVEETLMKEF